jgi:hypothetical protein
MNATGTQRQLAVLSAFRVKPEASQIEIAKAAGVTRRYASIVIRDYLEAKAHERACQVPARTTPKPAADIAEFAPDRRFGGNSGPAACTEKQQALNAALATHPQDSGELKMQYCRRIAAIAGVNARYVQLAIQIIECEHIGAERRAKEEARAKVEIVPRVVSLGAVQNFKGWLDAFSKFKQTAEAYLLLAQTRGDVYAAAFLADIRDKADRAQSRAAISKTG